MWELCLLCFDGFIVWDVEFRGLAFSYKQSWKTVINSCCDLAQRYDILDPACNGSPFNVLHDAQRKGCQKRHCFTSQCHGTFLLVNVKWILNLILSSSVSHTGVMCFNNQVFWHHCLSCNFLLSQWDSSVTCPCSCILANICPTKEKSAALVIHENCLYMLN